MFAIATKNFVKEVDEGGFLIPASSLNEAVGLLTVVVKRKRFWFWQKPKYHPTDFVLSDLLTGDTPVKPVVVETDFIKYSGTYGDNIQGTMDASFAKVTISMEGKDSSKLQSSFGSLKKEEAEVQKLLLDCKDSVLDMSHCLIQQTKEKHRQVFGIVKERIVTTQPCSVIEEVQQAGQCGGGLTSCGPKSHKLVSLKENGKLNKDSNITMEIPTQTTIAYGVLELEVKQDGRFELCLMSDTNGGFEVDGTLMAKELLGVSGAPVETSGNHIVQQQLEDLRDHFQLLSALPPSTRASLLQQISELMEEPEAISVFQTVLDQMCVDKKPGLADVGMTESHCGKIQNVLDLLELSSQVESSRMKSVFTALHLMISALDEMTEDCLAVLRKCSIPIALQTLELLVQCVSGDKEMTLSSSDLTEDLFETTEHLFASFYVSLKRNGNIVRAEIHHRRNLPLVLCIAIRCLASLTRGFPEASKLTGADEAHQRAV
uniref:Deafness, autosomal dominant 5 n=2 Tax=Iconisemion striatum TaxID=60296 RepID=A0A1A7X742_9TELE